MDQTTLMWVAIGLQIFTTVFGTVLQPVLGAAIAELRATNCCRKNHVYDYLHKKEQKEIEVEIDGQNMVCLPGKDGLVCQPKKGNKKYVKEKLAEIEKLISDLQKEL